MNDRKKVNEFWFKNIVKPKHVRENTIRKIFNHYKPHERFEKEGKRYIMTGRREPPMSGFEYACLDDMNNKELAKFLGLIITGKTE